MEPVLLLDCAGRRRSPATLSSFHQGRAPRNKGLRYPPDPPSVEEIIAVMRACASRPEGVRLRAIVVVLARRSADQRGARADRERSGPPPRRHPGSSWEGWQAARGRHGPLGLGAARPVAEAPRRPARRAAVLRAARPDPRPPLRTGGDPLRAAPRRRGGRDPSTVRAPPAQTRACGRDVPRRDPAARDPSANSGTPTWPSPAPTCAGSTTPRSSTPSTNAPSR